MKITTIKVVYGDGAKKREEFTPPKKAEVHLTADVDENESYQTVLDQMALDAVTRVAQMIGIRGPDKPKVKEVTDKDKLAEAAGLPPVEPVVTPRPPRAGIKKTDPKPDPAQIDLEELTEPLEEELETVSSDDLADIMAVESAPTDIPDDELMAKITHYNGATKNSPAIRALVVKFSPGTDRKYQAIEMPQANRLAFIEALKKVPKLA